MKRGYVKLWRKSLEGGLLQNQKLWAFWCWCLLKASHKKHKQLVGFREIELDAGQFVFGRKKASKELKMSERCIRTCLENLKKTKKATIKTTNNRPASDHKQEGIENGENEKKYRLNAQIVLDYLNSITGKKYQNKKNIIARLKDGGTVEECKKIIDIKSHDPYFKSNPNFIAPTTLFKKCHWDDYVNQSLDDFINKDQSVSCLDSTPYPVDIEVK